MFHREAWRYIFWTQRALEGYDIYRFWAEYPKKHPKICVISARINLPRALREEGRAGAGSDKGRSCIEHRATVTIIVFFSPTVTIYLGLKSIKRRENWRIRQLSFILNMALSISSLLNPSRDYSYECRVLSLELHSLTTTVEETSLAETLISMCSMLSPESSNSSISESGSFSYVSTS
jgi:hypothetical protein